MRKIISKLSGLFSLGLLLVAVTGSYALADEIKQDEIKQKDAWAFMEQNTKDGGADFRRKFGQNINDIKDGGIVVACGNRACVLTDNVCITREHKLAPREWLCIKKEKLSKYTGKGWKAASDEEIEQFSSKRGKRRAVKVGAKENCFEAISENADDKRVFCIEVTGDQVTVRAGQQSGAVGCEVVEVAWYNSKDCMFCPLLGVLYKASDNVSQIAQKSLATSFSIIIGVGLLIWIAYRTLIFVSELSKQDAAKYITEILELSFKFLIAFFALLFYDDIFTFIINPIIRAGMEFGMNFIDLKTLEARFPEAADAIKSGNASVLATLSTENKIPMDYSMNANNKFFSLATYAKMENLAHNVNEQYSLLQAVGRSLMCVGLKLIGGTFDYDESFGLGFASIVYGICFTAFGYAFTVAFIFYLFDAVVQLGIVGALLPALIAAWPFKLTSQYTKKGFEMLLNSTFIFMMMGLMTDLCIKLISAAVDSNITKPKEGEKIIALDGLSALVQALSLPDMNALYRLVNVISVGFILFLVANIISMMLLQKVKSFAGKFSSGCLPDIGNNAGGVLASASKGAVGKALSPGAVSKGISQGFKKGTSGSRQIIKNGFKNIRNKFGDKVSKAIGIDGVLSARRARKDSAGRPDTQTQANNQQSIDDIFK